MTTIINTALRKVDLLPARIEPWGTNGLGLFIIIVSWRFFFCLVEVVSVGCAGVFPQKTPAQIFIKSNNAFSLRMLDGIESEPFLERIIGRSV